MPEYMTYERLEKIAKAVGAKFEMRNSRGKLTLYDVGSGGVEAFMVMLSDGSFVKKAGYLNQAGWYKNTSSRPTKYSYVSDLKYGKNKISGSYEYTAFFAAECTISDDDIKKGIEMLQRKPIFVGTKQVSTIYVKQNGTIKTAKPYIKQSGQIKAL